MTEIIRKIQDSEPNPDDIWGDDRLYRNEIAEHLTHILASANSPFVMNINSPWGTGKTFFLKRWQLSIRDKHPSLFFNAWETDYSDDPFIAFISEVKSQLQSLGTRKQTIKKKIDKLVDTGHHIFLKGGPLLIKTFVRYALKEKGVDELSDLLHGDTVKDMSKLVEKLSKEAVDEHLKKKKSINSFKAQLENTVTEITSGASTLKLPLFVFIDELDRCRPTYAIELLEHIKHLFCVPGLVFIIATDTCELGHSIRSIYGTEFNTDGYLRRFIDQTYRLPLPVYEEFAYVLWQKLDLESIIQSHRKIIVYRSAPQLSSLFATCAKSFQLTLREQEQCMSKFRAIVIISKSNEIHLFPLFMFFLIMAQIKMPDAYNDFHIGTINLQQFYRIIREEIMRLRRQDVQILKLVECFFLNISDDESIKQALAPYARNTEMSYEDGVIYKLLFSINDHLADCRAHLNLVEFVSRLDPEK